MHELVRVYVWQIPVRVTHWLIALSIVVLSVTGLYIGQPVHDRAGPAAQSFVMGWMKVIHGYTAYVFIAAVLARVIWMFTGNKYARWDKFSAGAPRTRQQGHACRRCSSTCSCATSRRATSATTRSPASAYALVFGLYFLAILDRLGHARGQRRARRR